MRGLAIEPSCQALQDSLAKVTEVSKLICTLNTIHLEMLLVFHVAHKLILKFVWEVQETKFEDSNLPILKQCKAIVIYTVYNRHKYRSVRYDS